MAQLKERPKPFLLPDFCKGCGRCISACVKGCISLGSEIDSATGYVPVVLDLEDCNGCGLCTERCPGEAIRQELHGVAPTVDRTVCIGCGVFNKATRKMFH